MRQNQAKADELRGGTYYGQGGGQGGKAPAAAAPSFAKPDLEAEARKRGLIQ